MERESSPLFAGVPTGQAALDAVRDDIALVPDDRVGIYNLDATHAATVVLGAWPQIHEHRALLEKLYDYDPNHLKLLPVLCHALIHCNALVIAHSPEASNFDKLATETRALREDFLRIGDLMVGRGANIKASLATIREGSGNLDLMADLSALLLLVKPQSGKLAEPADIARAEQLEAELPHSYARFKGRDPMLAPLLKQRAKVGARVITRYSEIQAGLQYTRRHEDDAAVIAPSLYVPKGPRRGSAIEETPEPEPAPAPAPAPAKPANPLLPSDNPFDNKS